MKCLDVSGAFGYAGLGISLNDVASHLGLDLKAVSGTTFAVEPALVNR